MAVAPRGMKQKYTLKDRIFSWQFGVIVFTVIVMLAWLYARIWPEKGWFLFLVPPIPMDCAPFIALHAWAAYFMGKWWLDARKYPNPQVFTATGHFATSPKHVKHIGPFIVFPRGMLDQSLTTRAYATEGWLVTLAALTEPLDSGDTWAPVQELPCSLSGMPPIVSQELGRLGFGPDTELYFGFPAKFMIPDEESAAKAIDILRSHDKVNKWLTVDDEQHQIFVNAIDRANTIVRTMENAKRGVDDPIEPPRYVRAAETSERR